MHSKKGTETSNGGVKHEGEELRKFPLIGVEPIMFMFMMGFRIIYVVEEAFFLYKACTVDLGYPINVCKHISMQEYSNYSAEVQIKVSLFHQYNNAGLLGLPALLVLYLGAWSDRVGRKIPLLLGLFGYFIHSLMMALIALNDRWSLTSILYAATIPGSLTGRDWTIYMACFSYLSDTTSNETRTLRSTFLAVSYLLPIPLGVALGSYLYNGPFKGSFFLLFLTSSGILALSIIYTVIFIPWKTFETNKVKENSCCFSPVTGTIKTINNKRRLLLILSLIAIALSGTVKDESKIIQLYTFWKFNWDVKTYSFFKTFEAGSFVFGLMVCTPLLQRFCKIKDAYIMILGGSSFLLSRIIYIVSQSPLWLYIGAIVSTTGPIIGPVGRSVASKVVHVSERGKMFALVGLFELSARLLASIGYSQAYMRTIRTSFPQAFFLVTTVCDALIIGIGLYIHWSILEKRNVEEESDEHKTSS